MDELGDNTKVDITVYEVEETLQCLRNRIATEPGGIRMNKQFVKLFSIIKKNGFLMNGESFFQYLSSKR